LSGKLVSPAAVKPEESLQSDHHRWQPVRFSGKNLGLSSHFWALMLECPDLPNYYRLESFFVCETNGGSKAAATSAQSTKILTA